MILLTLGDTMLRPRPRIKKAKHTLQEMSGGPYAGKKLLMTGPGTLEFTVATSSGYLGKAEVHDQNWKGYYNSSNNWVSTL